MADGLLAHPFLTERYLREVTVPALERGAIKTGRAPGAPFEIGLSAFVALDEAEVEAVRRQIYYYGSTPEGYSLYLNGQRVFTVNDLAHLTWNPSSGSVSILDGSGTSVSLRSPPGFTTPTWYVRTRTPRTIFSLVTTVTEAALRMKRKISGLAPGAADQLLRYEWPGNVRELENAMERAVALARGNCVELEDLPEEIRQAFPVPVVTKGAVRPLEQIEKEYILAA